MFNMNMMFHGAEFLSNAHKGLIHTSFSSNPNWTNWSASPCSSRIPMATFRPRSTCVHRQSRRLLHGYISDWNTTAVTDMSNDPGTGQTSMQTSRVGHSNDEHEMFTGLLFFNQPIGNWDVSSSLDSTFMNDAFNQPIGN